MQQQSICFTVNGYELIWKRHSFTRWRLPMLRTLCCRKRAAWLSLCTLLSLGPALNTQEHTSVHPLLLLGSICNFGEKKGMTLLLDRRSIDLSGAREKEGHFHYKNFLRASKWGITCHTCSIIPKSLYCGLGLIPILSKGIWRWWSRYGMWYLILKLSKSFYNESDILFLVHHWGRLTSDLRVVYIVHVIWLSRAACYAAHTSKVKQWAIFATQH